MSRGRAPASADATGHQLLALELVGPAPDAVWFPDLEGVGEARTLHGARGADRLGPPLAKLLLILAFEVGGREEDGGMRTLTGRLLLPELLGAMGTQPETPFPSRAVSRGTIPLTSQNRQEAASCQQKWSMTVRGSPALLGLDLEQQSVDGDHAHRAA